ncbi:peptidyl-prolyl cis-trans isomerase B [[Clostridium] sordellii]|uniref:Peptidyl-prolyl cis-trans isomerase n=1 Tax=Paraclostridium sordellii TaxID=1505 RepID=A0ABP1XRP9_PARSO|nr:peptidylprolyl isomerase [Paeniclostridium sordellii]TAN64968.1 peptidylprolyl isomerase [Paeniclostridium sordellii 8483]CEJ74031.1 peptidyl-prolyl cis-trans isomerase, cyclophilin-type [[Clostridium] sordellii] [Paeniclostridium sordellii]CEK29609.1 peptidyl-prolyl cis-trans isomerase B [[Clostridium] sordellii] [Paeniclostridium sordellii]CEN69576.1 peptidyl-prolyl cis-trans isomerase B [[Clostridium] sordellii] [Paeniclostridium sordellii]CEN72844.1 peptidyl-prolyl cis-trans isomerase B
MGKVLKNLILIIMVSSSILIIDGCSKKIEITNKPLNPPKELPIATINIKDYGTIKAELYPHLAPNTVNNFIELANNEFYNGLIIHRVVKDFVIQGGDPEGSGIGGPGYSIKGEFEENGFRNDLKHEKGVLSMARSQQPDSAGSQFFIVTKDSPNLDKKYAAFGKVISGIEIVDDINSVEVDKKDKPKEKIEIESISVDTRGIEYNKSEKTK